MRVLGIDPGLSGAIAAVGLGGKASVWPMPSLKIDKSKRALDEHAICQYLEERKSKILHVFIEKVAAMPGQGVVSMFTFGAGWGLLRGICVGLHLPYTLVAPTTWKKVMCRDLPKGKDVSILVAKRMWPNVSLKPTRKCEKDSDGMADALCIAGYGATQTIWQYSREPHVQISCEPKRKVLIKRKV